MKTSTISNNSWKRKLTASSFWILLWALIAGIIQKEIYLPGPVTTLQHLVRILTDADAWFVLGISWLRVWSGFLLSFVLGIALGFPSGLHQRFQEWLKPMIQTIKSTPIMSLILLILIWFPSNLVPVVVGFLIGFPILWAQTNEGVKRTDPKLLEMARVFGLSPMQRMRKILFPSAWPSIRTASQTAIGLCWKASIAAEVLSHPRYGIGSKLYDAKVYLETADLFAWTLALILASGITERIFLSIFKQRRDLHADA